MRESKSVSFELKSIAEDGTFTGLASTYGNVDLGGDVVERGAFTKTLQERGAQVPILWQHDQKNPIGLGTLTDSPEGLVIKGRLDLDIEQGQRAYSGLKKGYLKGLSIGYDVVKQRYADGARHLTELKLYEVSTVTFPMNEEATITSVKGGSAATVDALTEARRHIRDGRRSHAKADNILERLLERGGVGAIQVEDGTKAGAIHSAATTAQLHQAHDHLADGHDAYSKARDILEELLEQGGQPAVDARDGISRGDEKALADLLLGHTKRMRELFAPARPAKLDDLARRMRWNGRRISALLDGVR
jgi:HK97 family phage prohead protease